MHWKVTSITNYIRCTNPQILSNKKQNIIRHPERMYTIGKCIYAHNSLIHSSKIIVSDMRFAHRLRLISRCRFHKKRWAEFINQIKMANKLFGRHSWRAGSPKFYEWNSEEKTLKYKNKTCSFSKTINHGNLIFIRVRYLEDIWHNETCSSKWKKK